MQRLYLNDQFAMKLTFNHFKKEVKLNNLLKKPVNTDLVEIYFAWQQSIHPSYTGRRQQRHLYRVV